MKKYSALIFIFLFFSCDLNKKNQVEYSSINNYAITQEDKIDYLLSPWPYSNHKSGYSMGIHIDKLLGFPKGGGTEAPDNTSVITLGLAGGQFTINFSKPIENNPNNIRGFDFIVFGNAFWGNPEPAFVEVMEDKNGNGIQDSDEKWNLLVHPDNRTYINKISVTYNKADYSDRWPDKAGESITVETWTIIDGFNNRLGVADSTPTLKLGDTNGDNTVDNINMSPENFYTIPDTPGDQIIDAGSGGGDAFDISWAVDRETLQPVILNSVKWIRVISPKDNNPGDFGPFTPEIDAITRVKTK